LEKQEIEEMCEEEEDEDYVEDRENI